MVLISLVPVLNLLYFYISTSRSMCAVPNVAVLCSSLTSCFPGMLLTYFLNDFEIVPIAPIITGNTFVFIFHVRCIIIIIIECRCYIEQLPHSVTNIDPDCQWGSDTGGDSLMTGCYPSGQRIKSNVLPGCWFVVNIIKEDCG
jgi:hypothetical protein